MLVKYYEPTYTLTDAIDRLLQDPFLDDWFVDRIHKRTWAESVEDNKLTLSYDVPGCKLADLSVVVDGSLLKVTGVRDKRKFDYQYLLSKNYDPDTTKASLSDGVLKVTFEKKKDSSSRTIRITSE